MEPDTVDVNKDEVQRALAAFVENAGSRQAAAESLGISRVYLWRMMQGDRPISESVLKAIGYERISKTVNEYKKVS